MPTKDGFNKYFSLDEAVALLPDIQKSLEQAHQEIAALRDELILSKRLIMAKQASRLKPSEAELELLQKKYDALEDKFHQWVHAFAERGIILRDLDTGLIDFPYRSNRDGKDYFLCWRRHEDGIFYFHGMNDGFAGRYPISLLPD